MPDPSDLVPDTKANLWSATMGCLILGDKKGAKKNVIEETKKEKEMIKWDRWVRNKEGGKK